MQHMKMSMTLPNYSWSSFATCRLRSNLHSVEYHRSSYIPYPFLNKSEVSEATDDIPCSDPSCILYPKVWSNPGYSKHVYEHSSTEISVFHYESNFIQLSNYLQNLVHEAMAHNTSTKAKGQFHSRSKAYRKLPNQTIFS